MIAYFILAATAVNPLLQGEAEDELLNEDSLVLEEQIIRSLEETKDELVFDLEFQEDDEEFDGEE